MTRLPWWNDGIRFECQQSGRCCVSHGEFGFVYVTREDRARLAAHFGLTAAEFVDRYCVREDGWIRFADPPGATACRFLEGTACGIYEARPTQCRTWPFWPEVMSAKAWTRDVASFCPGIGKGRLVPADEIRRTLEHQRRATDDDDESDLD